MKIKIKDQLLGNPSYASGQLLVKAAGGEALVGLPILLLYFTGTQATCLRHPAPDREGRQGRAGGQDPLLEDTCSKEGRGEEKTGQGATICAWVHKQPWWLRAHPQGAHGPEAVNLYHIGSCSSSLGNYEGWRWGWSKIRDIEKPESIQFTP